MMKVFSCKSRITKDVEPTPEQFAPRTTGKASWVRQEYERRSSLGFEYDWRDDRGVHIMGTSPEDQKGWEKVTKRANALIARGDVDTTIKIHTNSGRIKVTAPEWQAFNLAYTEFEQELFEKFDALVEMSPIPMDFADDKYWPSGTES